MENQRILSEIVVQILGFLIVFWILKRFAWKGLLGVIDKRRQTIADAFASLETKKQDLERLEVEYRSRLSNIEEEARVKIREASLEGQKLAREIQDQARREGQKMVDRAHEEIQRDIVQAKVGLRDQVVDVSALIAEKILREKIDEKEHDRLVKRFIQDIDSIDLRKERS